MKYLPFFIVLTAIALTSGCASHLTGDTYSRDDAQKVQQVQFGTIVAVRTVVIEGTKTPIGAGAGAIVGGLAGSNVGGGKGSSIGAVVGAVAGGLGGAAAEEAFTKTQGIEVTVRLDGSNETKAVMQEATPTDSYNLRVGARVRLLSVNGETRVSP